MRIEKIKRTDVKLDVPYFFEGFGQKLVDLQWIGIIRIAAIGYGTYDACTTNLLHLMFQVFISMNYKTFFKFGSWAMLATGAIHSLSFLNEPQPQNDSERQLFDLLKNYRFDLAGTMRSMQELMNFFSLSLTLLCLFAGVINLLIVKHFDNEALAKKVVTFNAVFWTIYLVPLYLLTFLPPQVCFTVAWAGYAAAYWFFQKR